MSLIKPLIDLEVETLEDEFLPGTNEALEAAGLNPQASKITEKSERAKKIFEDAGASVDDAARTIAGVMMNGDTDQARLKASELALRVGEVFKDLDDEKRKIPSVIVNIVGTRDSKQLINLLVPSISE